jgi:hypothetical protein
MDRLMTGAADPNTGNHWMRQQKEADAPRCRQEREPVAAAGAALQ